MKIEPIKTRPLLPPQDDLFSAIKASIKTIPEKSILVVTSKVVAIHQGRCVPIKAVKSKDELIKQEAEKYLPRSAIPGEHVMLTLKNNLLIPTAGIDASNANTHYILWPEKPKQSAQEIHQFIKQKYSINHLGIIITDSHTIPLRWGVTGISLAHAGFCPLNDYRGKPDIFGRKLKFTLSNVADSLAAAAVITIGEGNEQTPLALITDIPFVKFGSCPSGTPDLEIDPEIDLYAPLLHSVNWKKGKGNK